MKRARRGSALGDSLVSPWPYNDGVVDSRASTFFAQADDLQSRGGWVGGYHCYGWRVLVVNFEGRHEYGGCEC